MNIVMTNSLVDLMYTCQLMPTYTCTYLHTVHACTTNVHVYMYRLYTQLSDVLESL